MTGSLPVGAHLQGCKLAEDDVVGLLGQLVLDGGLLCAAQQEALQQLVQLYLPLLSLLRTSGFLT